MDSFKLLSENDLNKLGFKMGARKLDLQWITAQTASDDSPSYFTLL